MARYKVAYHAQVTDINGDVATATWNTSYADTQTIALMATEMATLQADLAAVTNGKITRQSISILLNEAQFLVGTTPPTDAEYSSVTDGARLQFADGAGERASITIPAPIEAVFGSNSNVVDSTQTAMATFITDTKAILADLNGTNLNLYKGGIKVGRRARRRRSALVP